MYPSFSSSCASFSLQVIRLWANATGVDFDFTIGPIPYADGVGKEIVNRCVKVLSKGVCL